MEQLLEYQNSQTFDSFPVYISPEQQNIFGEDTKNLLNRLFKSNERMFLLQGSGFNMESQIKKWIDGFKESYTTGQSIEEVKKKLIDQTISDVSGFYFEYISEHDIFPFELEVIKTIDGGKTVYSSKYKETLRNLVLPEEREGALLEGIDTAVEMIINSGPNTVVFLNSPDGWSNLKRNGKDIVFPDNQTYVYWIDKDGDLKAMTLRTYISIDEAEDLVNVKNTNDRRTVERIKNVVKSPIKMSVVTDGFLEVLDQIESKTGERFEKLRNEVIHRDVYNSLTSDENKEVGIILEELRQFMSDEIMDLDEKTIKSLAYKIGKSILDMKDAVNKRKQKFDDATKAVTGYDSPEVKYYILSKEVQQLLGCAGGGERFGFGQDHMGPLTFKCQNGHTNTRPFGQLIQYCKECGIDMSCKTTS